MSRTLQYISNTFFVTCLAILLHDISIVFADETTHTLYGIVIQADKKPIPGAVVTLSPTGYADTTDTVGQFRFSNVPSGEYILIVSVTNLGFENVHKIVTVPVEDPSRLEIIVRDRTYQIDEVVVLSGRENVREEIEKIPSFVTIVERSEFENTSTTVADVIMATPSANITTMGGLGDYTEVSLRGSYSNQVQVYIDGMLLNEAFGGAVNLGTIPLTNVENIEVWRSGAPAQFGGNAVGGVINIRTRDTHVSQKTFSLGYGSFNTLTANTVIDIPIGMSHFHATIDYSSSENNFLYKSDNGTMYNKDDDFWAHRYNDEYRSLNLLGKYNYIFRNGMLLELSEHIFSNRKNLPGKDNIRYSDASLETIKNLFQAKMTMNSFFKDLLEFKPIFHHIYSYEHYRDTHGTVGWGFQDNKYTTNSYDFLIPLTFMASKYATLNLTPTVKHETFSPDFKLEKYAPLSCQREQFALVFDALFKTPGERLTLTSNIRRDRYFSSYNGQPSIVNRKTPKSSFNHTTNSNVGVKLNVWNGFTVQSNYGDITRVPSLYELFGDRGNTLSNPDLKPEHIYRWDIGGKARLRKTGFPVSATVECSYFENSFKNLIQWYTYDAGFIHPDNVGESYVKGIEIVWNSRILELLIFSGNWTFQQSKVTSEKRKSFRDKQLPNRPKNYGNMKLEYPLKNTAISWILNHKSSYYLDRANQDHKRYPGRTLHDLGFSTSFMRGKTTCTVLVKNISDVHTFDIQGMPKPGRSFMITFVYSTN